MGALPSSGIRSLTKSRKRPRSVPFLVGSMVAAAALILSACQAASSPSAPPETDGEEPEVTSTPVAVEPIPVRFGPSSNIFFVSMFVLDAKPEFQEECGIDAEVRVFSTGVESMETMIAGQNDIAIAAALPLIRTIDQGSTPILPTMYVFADDQKLVGSTSIQEPADLVGKRVALPAGTSSDYAFQRYMEEYDVPKDQVEIVYSDPSELATVVARGDADAMVWVEPQAGTVIELMGEDQAHYIEPTIGTVFIDNGPLQVGPHFYEEYGDAGMIGILCALDRANQFVVENPEETAEIAAEVLQLEPERVTELMADQREWPIFWRDESVENLQGVADWMLENDLISAVPDWCDFIDTTWLDEVRPEGNELDEHSCD